MNYEIRKMCDNDLQQVHDIECRIFSVPWSISSFAKDLLSDKTLYIVAIQDTQIIGYAGLWKLFDEGHITNIGVHPEFQNKGIGYQLCQNLLENSRAQGIMDFTLEVRVSNTAAITLYKKCGFKSVGERKNYYVDPTENAMIMWLYDKERN